MIRSILLTATAVATLGMANPLAAQNVVITNATVATGDGSDPIENATVVIQDGRVVSAGTGGAAPAGATIIDGAGKWVTPGLFAAATTLGLWDVGSVSESNDQAASGSPFSAALDVAPALNPASQHVAIARAGGITRASVYSRPSSSIFGGQGAMVDLGTDANMLMRPRAFQMVALGESGARLGGGSRTGAHALLRNALREAGQYGDDSQLVGRAAARERDVSGDDLPIDPRLLDNATERGSDTLLTRFDAAALVPVVRGQQPLYVLVERAADIQQVLALKSEFADLDLVLVGVSEGWLVANDIAAAGVPVIADALDDLPSSFEQLAATQSNVGRMIEAGVQVAIGGLDGGTDGQPRSATQFAGNLVALGKLPGAAGLSWGQAFATISSTPAAIAGYSGRLGVLMPGAAGDLVLWDGDPLELDAAPTRVFIDGVEQPLVNHQTRLRDRYRDLDESDLPKAYDW
ncbi:MAG: amidohydrolase family protein [Pontixanthobacter sp.]